jgi:Flp pilus assembly pilin Flp
MSSISLPRRERRLKRGQTLVEYTLILAIISIVIISIFVQMTGNIRKIYSTIDSQVARANTGS